MTSPKCRIFSQVWVCQWRNAGTHQRCRLWCSPRNESRPVWRHQEPGPRHQHQVDWPRTAVPPRSRRTWLEKVTPFMLNLSKTPKWIKIFHYSLILSECWLLQSFIMGLLPDTQNCGCACARNAGNVFPVTAGERSRHASRHVRDARAVMHAGIAN